MFVTEERTVELKSRLEVLRLLDEAGGTTTEFPFVETGNGQTLDQLVNEGFLARKPRAGDLDEICITDKGRLWLEGIKIAGSGQVSLT